jgi:hypothetical protein
MEGRFLRVEGRKPLRNGVDIDELGNLQGAFENRRSGGRFAVAIGAGDDGDMEAVTVPDGVL